jgi:hypothetical protein
MCRKLIFSWVLVMLLMCAVSKAFLQVSPSSLCSVGASSSRIRLHASPLLAKPRTSLNSKLYAATGGGALCGDDGRHCNFQPPTASKIKLDNTAVFILVFILCDMLLIHFLFGVDLSLW